MKAVTSHRTPRNKKAATKSPHPKEAMHHPPQDDRSRAARLAERICGLNPLAIDEVERLVAKLEMAGVEIGMEKESGDESPHSKKSWPRAPLHRLHGDGTYIVTGGTLDKERHFRETELL